MLIIGGANDFVYSLNNVESYKSQEHVRMSCERINKNMFRWLSRVTVNRDFQEKVTQGKLGDLNLVD